MSATALPARPTGPLEREWYNALRECSLVDPVRPNNPGTVAPTCSSGARCNPLRSGGRAGALSSAVLRRPPRRSRCRDRSCWSATVDQLLEGVRHERGSGLSVTRREQEVIELVALGHTNVEVAKTLGIALRTVETHRSRAASKLGLKSEWLPNVALAATSRMGRAGRGVTLSSPGERGVILRCPRGSPGAFGHRSPPRCRRQGCREATFYGARRTRERQSPR